MKSLFTAFTFLTRIPVPSHACPIHKSAWAFPIVGAFIGGVSAVGYYITLALDLPTMVGATIVVLLHCLLTGALHYDGLADTADGLWGATTKAKRLTIMSDSRLGSYGAIALILIILIKIQIISAIGDVYMVGYSLIVTGALSRSLIVLMQATSKSAKKDGLVAVVGKPSALQTLLAIVIGLAITFVIADVYTIAYLFMATIITVILLRIIFYAKIGGITGDCLGTSQVIGEVVLLLVLYVFLNMEKIGLGLV